MEKQDISSITRMKLPKVGQIGILVRDIPKQPLITQNSSMSGRGTAPIP